MLKLPMYVMYFSLVLAFGLIFVVQLVVLAEKVQRLLKKDEKEAAS